MDSFCPSLLAVAADAVVIDAADAVAIAIAILPNKKSKFMLLKLIKFGVVLGCDIKKRK